MVVSIVPRIAESREDPTKSWANPAMNQMSESTRAIVPYGEVVGNESVPGGTTSHRG